VGDSALRVVVSRSCKTELILSASPTKNLRCRSIAFRFCDSMISWKKKLFLRIIFGNFNFSHICSIVHHFVDVSPKLSDHLGNRGTYFLRFTLMLPLLFFFRTINNILPEIRFCRIGELNFLKSFKVYFDLNFIADSLFVRYVAWDDALGESLPTSRPPLPTGNPSGVWAGAGRRTLAAECPTRGRNFAAPISSGKLWSPENEWGIY
jgi:hypothetical protein